MGFVTEAFNGRENFICGFGPSIRLGLFVMALDEGADVGFQLPWLKAWAMQIARRRGMKKAIRGAGTPAGRDHAPYVGGRHRAPLDIQGVS